MTGFELTVQTPRRRARRAHLVSVLAFDVVADTVVYVDRRPRHLDPEQPTVQIVGPNAGALARDVYTEALKALPPGHRTANVFGRHTRRYRELVDTFARYGLEGLLP